MKRPIKRERDVRILEERQLTAVVGGNNPLHEGDAEVLNNPLFQGSGAECSSAADNPLYA